MTRIGLVSGCEWVFVFFFDMGGYGGFLKIYMQDPKEPLGIEFTHLVRSF